MKDLCKTEKRAQIKKKKRVGWEAAFYKPNY